MKLVIYPIRNILRLALLLVLTFNFFGIKAQSFSFSVSPANQCYSAGSNTAIAAVTNSAAGATSYTWIVQSPTMCAVSLSVLATNGSVTSIYYPCCGTYTIYCYAYNGATLISSISSIVTIYCSPPVSISGNNSICFGSTTTLTAIGALTYTWNNLSTGPNFVVTPTVNTCYSVATTNTFGCAGSASICVNLQPNPVPNFTFSVLANGAVQFTNLSTGTVTGTTYTWSFGNNITSNGLSPLTTYTSNGNYLVTLAMNNNSPGCGTASATNTLNVTTILTPTCNAGFNYTVTAGGVVNFASTSATPSIGATNYSWSFGAGTPSSGITLTSTSKTYSINNNYVVSLTITNSLTGCSSTSTQTITVLSASNNCSVTISYTPSSAPIPSCNGSAQVTNVSGLCGAPSYTWLPGGFTGPSISGVCGTYTLTVGSSSGGTFCCTFISSTVSIPTNSCNLVSNFTYSQSNNGLVNFTSTSSGTLSSATYSWTYGDASIGVGANSAHTYSANGSYSVILYVKNNVSPSCNDSSLVQTVVVNSYSCNLNANFSYSLGANGLANFVNTSVGTSSTTSYSWNFGDATNAALANPTHVYAANGTYIVTLTVNNNSTPVCISTKTISLVISSYPPCSLSASFTHTAGTLGGVGFSSNSTGTSSLTAYLWNFGDGYTGTGANPFHTYLNGGAHLVTLQISQLSCTDTSAQYVNITSLACTANANFSLAPTFTPQYWSATPAYPYNVIAATWNWGDGASSNLLYASHQYSASATYSVCLSVTVSCGSATSACSSYFVYKPNGTEGSGFININVVKPTLQPVGLRSELLQDAGILIYPNPNAGSFNIQASGLLSGKNQIVVINLMGELLYNDIEENDGSILKELNLNHVGNGVYFVKIITPGKTYIQKIIVSK